MGAKRQPSHATEALPVKPAGSAHGAYPGRIGRIAIGGCWYCCCGAGWQGDMRRHASGHCQRVWVDTSAATGMLPILDVCAARRPTTDFNA